MANGLDAIFDTLEAINHELNVLTARLNALEQGTGLPGAADGAQEGRATGAPIVWASIPDEERAALWEEFVDWTLWMADTYELTPEQLPRQCWWQHGSAVEELTALWTAHQSAYNGTDDVGSAPYLWQDALARCVERLNRVWLGGCTNGFHDPKTRTAFRDDAYRLQLLKAVGGGPDLDATGPPGL